MNRKDYERIFKETSIFQKNLRKMSGDSLLGRGETAWLRGKIAAAQFATFGLGFRLEMAISFFWKK